MPQRKNILVIGAGIIGASIAYHLARDGARVTILDAGQGGGIATRYSWAWINASWGNPEPYFRLRMRAIDPNTLTTISLAETDFVITL